MYSELLHCALRIVAYPDRNAPWNLYTVACQDRKALWSTLLPWVIHEYRCLIVGIYNAFKTSLHPWCVAVWVYNNATIQKTIFYELGVYYARGCAYHRTRALVISLLCQRNGSRRQINNNSILYYFALF